jgi:hypothetical protein
MMLQVVNKPIENIINAFRSIQGVTNDDKKGNQNLINTLREMENAYIEQVANSVPTYDATLPKTTGGIMKTYDEKSDAELEAQAKDAVFGGIDEKINKLNQSTQKKLDDMAKKLNLGGKNLVQDMEIAEDKMENSSVKNLYNAVRKGTMHSSIYDNMQESVYQAYKSTLDELKADYDNLNAEIEKEIAIVNSSKETALQEYDLEKASKLEKQLSNLKLDQQKAIASVNAYNKKIVDNETKFQIDRTKNIEKLENEWKKAKSEQYLLEKSSGYTGDNLTEMKTRYDLAKGFYFGVSKQSAKKLIEENQSTLKDALGEVYYRRLYEENNNR